MKFIVRTLQEITIKSRPVCKRFIRQLAKNIRTVLHDLDPELRVEGEWDNLEVETAVVNAKTRRETTEHLTCTPGIGHFLGVHEYPLGGFGGVLVKYKTHFGDQLAGKIFAVRCKCADEHAFTSMEVERYAGNGLCHECGAARIGLKQLEVEVRVEIRLDHPSVIHRQHPGLGSYPPGALEQALMLMSDGFDSTVAAHQMMRRRVISHFVSFNLGGHAYGLGVMGVTHYLQEEYSRSQHVLFANVSFEEVVGKILTKVDDSYMDVIPKRMMLRTVSHVAERPELGALVTGEAISQMPSQTLPSLSAIDRVTDTLVPHPLIASHKQDITDTARQIGTTESARHIPEYCGVTPVNLATQVKPYRVEHKESKFDMAVLECALGRVTQRTVDRVTDELGQDLQVEEVGEVLPGQIAIDIRRPDAQGNEPLALEGVEVQTLPFYAINSRFRGLDINRQYLLYCDKGVMSRLHVRHLLNEGHTSVRVYRPA